MSYQSYEKMLKRIGLLFGLLFSITLFKLDFMGPAATHAISIANYLAIRILVIFLLLFSIYAHIMRVKDTRTLEKPAVFIVLGALMVILYFGFPIALYFAMPNFNDDIFTHNQYKEIEDQATSLKNTPGWRFYLARKYFIDTGERLSYLDDDNKEVQYTPDEKTIKYRDELKESREKINSTRINMRITAYGLIGIIILSLIIFSGILSFKLKSSSTIGT